MNTVQTDYTEGRKGFSEGLRSQLPANYANKAFATHAEAVAVFAQSSIAFRVYEYKGTEMSKPFRVPELGAYVVISRAKKSGSCSGSSADCAGALAAGCLIMNSTSRANFGRMRKASA